MESKKIAVVGAGYWGKNHVRNLREMNQLGVICDANIPLLKEYRQLHPDLHVTSNLDSVLSDESIQGVVIATPVMTHFSLAEKVLLAGKDVLVEKPLCTHPDEAMKLIHLAQEQSAILMVGHLNRYHPAVLKMNEIIRQGDLGQVLYVSSQRTNLGKIRTEENSLWSLAPHDVSVILSLCGDALPQKITCMGGSELSEGIHDSCITFLQFESGIKAHIHVSWLFPVKERKTIIIGTKGMLQFDETESWDRMLKIYDKPVVMQKGVPQHNPQCVGEAIPLEEKQPLREELQHFIQCCKTRTKPLTDGHEGYRVLKTLSIAHEQLNAPVAIGV